jgi:hypothetical protein
MSPVTRCGSWQPHLNLDAMMTKDASVLASRLSVFPRIGIASLPTPLEPMRRLTAYLGGPRF